MCAFNAALDFGKDMIELSASTLGRLIGIQLEDLATFLEHQSVAVSRVAEVQNVAGLLALQREYRDAFWKDRRMALTAATEALQVAAQLVAHSWTERLSEPVAPAALAATKPATRRVKRKPIAAIAAEPDRPAAPVPGAVAKKRSARAKKGPGGTRSPPTATR